MIEALGRAAEYKTTSYDWTGGTRCLTFGMNLISSPIWEFFHTASCHNKVTNVWTRGGGCIAIVYNLYLRKLIPPDDFWRITAWVYAVTDTQTDSSCNNIIDSTQMQLNPTIPTFSRSCSRSNHRIFLCVYLCLQFILKNSQARTLLRNLLLAPPVIILTPPSFLSLHNPHFFHAYTTHKRKVQVEDASHSYNIPGVVIFSDSAVIGYQGGMLFHWLWRRQWTDMADQSPSHNIRQNDNVRQNELPNHLSARFLLSIPN